MAKSIASGPSTDPELLILSSLAGGSKHGYAIMIDVIGFANIEIRPGTLYPAITRLVGLGWVEPCQSTGRQRPYRLTSSGLAHLREQLERMRRLANLGLRRSREVRPGKRF
jgi:DNA-binding PadR family transcriptional regulator